MYVVYDMKEYETCVGIFDKVKEVAEYFNTSKSSILTSISRGHLREHRYLVVRVEDK